MAFTVTKQDVELITLLSREEWEKAVSEVPNIPISTGGWWWLRSPGFYSSSACSVNNGGYVDRGYYGNANCTDIGVRPAFYIPHLSSNGCKPGDKITVGTKTVCTVISDDIALADNIVCKHRFDRSSNDWNASEIKKFINSDEFWKFV